MEGRDIIMADPIMAEFIEAVPRSFDSMLISEYSMTAGTRLAENVIQANTSIQDIDIWLRVFKDNRIGVSYGTSKDKASIKLVVEEAVASWKNNKSRSNLVVPTELTLPFVPVNDSAILNEQSVSRIKKLKQTISSVNRHGLNYSGSFTTNVVARELVTRSGLHVNVPATSVDVSCTLAYSESATGWARGFSSLMNDVDPVSLAVKAGGKALNSRRKTALKPGKYTVVLEPAAVGSMLLFLAFLSFGGSVFNRGTSFLSKKIGQNVLPKHISITDEPSDPVSHGWPFDYEGIPTKDIKIIENGVAKAVVHDSETAAQAGTESTGHALSPGNNFGPYPRCLKMASGSQSIKKILADAGRAVLVSRLWYVNYVNPMRTMITGSTRDGTFMLKNGRIETAVRDMRFEESILDAFNRSVLISKEREYVRQFGSTLCVPWMIIPDFTFTEVI
jgi:PmbA protein